MQQLFLPVKLVSDQLFCVCLKEKKNIEDILVFMG